VRSTVSVSAPVRALLAGAIDYAGLFPPATLDLTRALKEYLSIAASVECWALGRFVIPVGALPALLPHLRETSGLTRNTGVRLAVLLGSSPADEVTAIDGFLRESDELAVVEAVEVKAASAEAARAVLDEIPQRWIRYVEVASGPELVETLDLLQGRGGFAKLRTGGVTPDAFPGPEAVLDFLEGCARRRLPFKATAGLHHPVRGDYRLTYAPAAPTTTMYGFLNLFLAAVMLWTGTARSAARGVLLETDPTAFRFDGTGITVHGHVISADALQAARTEFVHGFGSCSFREPWDELLALAPA